MRIFPILILFFVTTLYSDISYSISIGTFNNLKNAQNLKNNSIYNAQINMLIRPYKVYIGSFDNKASAKKELKKIQHIYTDAYIIKMYNQTKKSKKKAKDNSDLNENFFKEAKNFFHQKRYEEALMAYDRELIIHPNNLLAKLEYARTLYKLQIYKSAKKSFLEVLDTNPPTNVKKQITIYLKSIDKKLTSNNFYANIDLSITYDENINYATYKHQTLYAGILFDNNQTKIKGTYKNININLIHLYKNDYLSWKNSFYTYNELQDKNKANDLNYLNYTSTLKKKYNDFIFSMPIGASYLYLDQYSEYSTIFTMPNIKYLPSKDTQVKVTTKYEKLKHKKDKDKSYNTTSATISYIKFYKSMMLYGSLATAKEKKASGERLDIDNKKNTISLGLKYKPLNKTIFNFNLDIEREKYTDTDPALEYKREDKKIEFSTILSQEISNKSSIYLKYINIYNNSNVNNYSYKKSNYSIGLNIGI